MLKAGLISCWNEKQNLKSYLPANKHSVFDLNLSSHKNLACKNYCFVIVSVSTKQNGIAILKIPSARYVAKKWINEVTKSRVLNEASLESKKLHAIKFPRIDYIYIYVCVCVCVCVCLCVRYVCRYILYT